jgi:hypothetical protein
MMYLMLAVYILVLDTENTSSQPLLLIKFNVVKPEIASSENASSQLIK